MIIPASCHVRNVQSSHVQQETDAHSLDLRSVVSRKIQKSEPPALVEVHGDSLIMTVISKACDVVRDACNKVDEIATSLDKMADEVVLKVDEVQDQLTECKGEGGADLVKDKVTELEHAFKSMIQIVHQIFGGGSSMSMRENMSKEIRHKGKYGDFIKKGFNMVKNVATSAINKVKEMLPKVDISHLFKTVGIKIEDALEEHESPEAIQFLKDTSEGCVQQVVQVGMANHQDVEQLYSGFIQQLTSTPFVKDAPDSIAACVAAIWSGVKEGAEN